MSAKQEYDKAELHVRENNFAMGSFDSRNATILFLNERNIDDAAKALVLYASCAYRLDMRQDAETAYILACELAEGAQLSALTCCQVWWWAGRGLGQLKNYVEANVWMGKTKELAEFAGLDPQNLPRHTNLTSSPSLNNDETQRVLKEICELLNVEFV